MNNADAWTAAQTAVADARDGRTSVLVIEGEAGFGKSRLLRRMVGELVDFDVRRAYGEQDAPDVAFSTLGELVGDAFGAANAFQAVGMLLALVDDLQREQPIAFLVDDLQWADADSVRALAGLLRRAVGDRLLLVVATRPLGREHVEFQRMLRDVSAVRVSLAGLSPHEVSDLVHASDVDAPAALAPALHAHTAGNPLHVIALLAEHSASSLAVLAANDELPAPLELAAQIEARLQELSPDAAELLGGLAVLGDGWVALDEAGAVAGVADARSAARILSGEGLIRSRGSGLLVDVRIWHSVTRAAVYEIVPDSKRRVFHQRSAELVREPGARLRHRAAAVSSPDDGLLADLVSYAAERFDSGQFREAARFLRIAAVVSAEADRPALELDAEFAGLLGRDPSSMREHLRGGDARDRLVVALSLSLRGEWRAAWVLLSAITPEELAALPERIAYRVLAVRVHAATGCGRPDDETLADVALAEALPADPAVARYVLFAKVHTWSWVMDEEDYSRVRGIGRDRLELASSLQDRSLLAWRGMTLALDGAVDDAIGDLSTVTALVGSGGLDFTEGNYHALLGLAQFLAGDSARASASIDVALSAGLAHTHPVTLAVSALRELLGGDAQSAREASARVRTVTLRNRYRGAVFTADIVDILVLASNGDDAGREEWLRRRRHELGNPLDEAIVRAPALWTALHGLAAAWGSSPAEAEEWAARLDGLLVAPEWRDDMVRWLRARGAVARGDDTTAELAALAAGGFVSVPVIAALVARDAAADSRTDAAAARPAEESPATSPAEDPLAPLSERERAVAVLVAGGMSYAQIAKELYISRSTVGFHLSNCYAKTGAASRHELAELARAAVA